MYAEDFNITERQMQLKRLSELSQSQVWEDDIKPFLQSKWEYARHIMRDTEDNMPQFWKAVGIMFHVENMVEYVENSDFEELLWQKRNGNNEKPKAPKPKKKFWQKLKRKKEVSDATITT